MCSHARPVCPVVAVGVCPGVGVLVCTCRVCRAAHLGSMCEIRHCSVGLLVVAALGSTCPGWGCTAAALVLFCVTAVFSHPLTQLNTSQCSHCIGTVHPLCITVRVHVCARLPWPCRPSLRSWCGCPAASCATRQRLMHRQCHTCQQHQTVLSRSAASTIWQRSRHRCWRCGRAFCTGGSQLFSSKHHHC